MLYFIIISLNYFSIGKLNIINRVIEFSAMQKRNAQEAAEIEYEKKRKRIAAGNNDDLESEDARTRRKN